MNRLQKKCIIATIGFHLLLLVVLLAGSAFRAPQSESIFPSPVTVYPASSLPSESSSLAEPQIKFPKSQSPTITLKTSVTPVNPIKPQAPLHVVVPDLKSVTCLSPTPPASEPSTNPYEVAIANLKNNFTIGTQVKIPEHDSELDSNYAIAVKEKYQKAWALPDDTSDNDAIAKVSVTIGKDGAVISAHILVPSGDANVDASVQRTLDNVSFVAPFPDGAKEKEKTFIINFNLKAKRMNG
jgi:TonB family protein